eukprot:6383443-Alexandrium_andersonii.AAC.1
MQALGGGVVLVPADAGAIERFLMSQKWAVAYGTGVSWLELTIGFCIQQGGTSALEVPGSRAARPELRALLKAFRKAVVGIVQA